MLSIYNYSCPSTYLKDRWEEKKTKNPSFSMRAWARSLGFTSNSPLSLMLNGKRPIPQKYIPKFIDSLDLSPQEGMYLETLVCYSREKTIEGKDFYLRRLRGLSPAGEVQMNEVETFKYLGNPLCTIIFEMIDLSNFKSDLKWIQSRLATKKTLEEIKSAIDTLFRLDLLTKDINGEFIKTNRNITNRADIADIGSQTYHQNVSELAKEAVVSQPVLNREFNGFSFNMKVEEMNKAKLAIREFINSFAAQFEAESGCGEETYQFNTQFFKLTQMES